MIKKQNLTKIFAILLILAISTICYLLIQIEDMHARIEAGVAGELILKTQRDFLLELPSIMREAQDKSSLEKLLKMRYPNTRVGSLSEDICWGYLRLSFTDNFELKEVVEDIQCDNIR